MYLLGVLSIRRTTTFPFHRAHRADEQRALFRAARRVRQKHPGSKSREPLSAAARGSSGRGQTMSRGLLQVKAAREQVSDSYYFNRTLHIPPMFQMPFTPLHDDPEPLRIERSDQPCEFAAVLRRVFSAVVYGNVKPEG